MDRQFAESPAERRERKLQRQCDAWNAAHAVGTAVVLTKDLGEKVDTKTRSKAQVLSGHSAVIWLEGVSGCWLLERVKPA
jgi:hypothetical protein